MSTVSLTDKRNDLHLTSSGVGHAIREKAVFPPLNFEVHEVMSRAMPELVSRIPTPRISTPKISGDCWCVGHHKSKSLQHPSIPMGCEQQGLKYFITSYTYCCN